MHNLAALAELVGSPVKLKIPESQHFRAAHLSKRPFWLAAYPIRLAIFSKKLANHQPFAIAASFDAHQLVGHSRAVHRGSIHAFSTIVQEQELSRQFLSDEARRRSG